MFDHNVIAEKTKEEILKASDDSHIYKNTIAVAINLVASCIIFAEGKDKDELLKETMKVIEKEVKVCIEEFYHGNV